MKPIQNHGHSGSCLNGEPEFFNSELLGQFYSLTRHKSGLPIYVFPKKTATVHAYNQKMSEIKNYFNADIVEQIALDKRQYENQMQSEFDRLTQEHKTQKSREIAEMVEQSEDLKALLYQESENYSPEVFGIVKQMFDLTGGVDLDVINKGVSSIKALGVKEHLAQQKANAEKQKASVPTGQAVTSGGEALTRDYAMANYEKLCEKYGMEKVDAIIMEG